LKGIFHSWLTTPQHHIDLTGSPSTSTANDVLYETVTPPPGTTKRGDAEVEEEPDDDDNHIEKEVFDFGTKNFGEMASPYISPYTYKCGFLDTTYGIRQIGDVFMIGYSHVAIDKDCNVHIKKHKFPATKGLWELMTLKTVNRKLITTEDLKQYKKILELTKSNIEGYERDANINFTTGLKFKEVI
jgi:hypothetical protein